MVNFSGTISIKEQDSSKKYIHKTGYLNPSNNYISFGDADVMVNYIGILNFNKTILSACNFQEKTSWNGFNFTNVSLTLTYRKDTKPTTSSLFTFALGHSSVIQTGTAFNNLTLKVQGIKPNAISGKNFTFNLTTLFQLLINSTDFLPNEDTWFLYIKCTSISTDSTFYRVSNDSCAHSISFAGNYSEPVTSPFYLYEDDKWKTLTPYIYDGKWIKLDAKMF